MFTGLIMIVIGLGPVRVLRRDAGMIERISLSFLAGFVLLTLPLFFLQFHHIRLNLTIVVGLISILSAISIILLILSVTLKKKNVQAAPKGSSKWSIVEWIVGGAIIFLMLCSFVINTYWPVTAWDAVALYDFLGHLFAQGGLLIDLAASVQFKSSLFAYYYSYTPIVPLSHAVGYLIHDPAVPVLYSFFYTSLLGIFYVALSRSTRHIIALVATLLVACSILFYHSLLAYTNLPYTVFIFASFIAAEQYWRSRKWSDFTLFSVLIVGATIIRVNEPYNLLLLIFVLFEGVRRRSVKIGASALLLGVLCFLLRSQMSSLFTRDIAYLHMSWQSITFDYIGPLLAVSRDPLILVKVVQYLTFALQSYHILLTILILISVIWFRFCLKNITLFLFIITSFLILIPGSVVLAAVYSGWDQIPDSVSRLMMFTIPLFYLYFGLFAQYTLYNPDHNNLPAQK